MRAAIATLLLAAACTSPQPCPTPLEECDGQCVDLQTDRRHCGGCGNGCPAGIPCAGATCTSPTLLPLGRAASAPPCAQRTGGAFVTLASCGDSVEVWVEDEGFIAGAEERLGADPDPEAIPSLAVFAGADCDARWSWHASPVAASFVGEPGLEPTLACSACPGAIEADVGAWIASPGSWCPGGATVVAVERVAP